MIDVDEVQIERRATAVLREHRHMLDALLALRKKHRLSQDEIASRMGVSQPTVSDFERYDSNPTLATIMRYAVAVGARFSIEVLDDCVPEGWEQESRMLREVSFATPLFHELVPASGEWTSVPKQASSDERMLAARA